MYERFANVTDKCYIRRPERKEASERDGSGRVLDNKLDNSTFQITELFYLLFIFWSSDSDVDDDARADKHQTLTSTRQCMVKEVRLSFLVKKNIYFHFLTKHISGKSEEGKKGRDGPWVGYHECIDSFPQNPELSYFKQLVALHHMGITI